MEMLIPTALKGGGGGVKVFHHINRSIIQGVEATTPPPGGRKINDLG